MRNLRYLAAYTIPLTAFIGIAYGGYWAFLTPVYAFVFIPVLELLLPEDAENLPAAAAAKARINPVFDWMLYMNIPIVYGLVYFGLGHVVGSGLVSATGIGAVLSVGIALGVNGINVGHELGHRSKYAERLFGKALLLPSLYTHFFIEHNYGHHRHAATREDPATARLNESLYGFWWRSITQQYRNAWTLQANLLKKQGKPFWSVYNDMLCGHLAQLGYLALVFAGFGTTGVLVVLACALVGVLLLESVNYIEHYGLLRMRLPSGRYERVREVHSWNSNHVVGRIVLYELTRHSDHHYKASKKYQLLQYHEASPEMPYGYPTSLVLATIPPLWFRVMNARVPPAMHP